MDRSFSSDSIRIFQKYTIILLSPIFLNFQGVSVSSIIANASRLTLRFSKVPCPLMLLGRRRFRIKMGLSIQLAKLCFSACVNQGTAAGSEHPMIGVGVRMMARPQTRTRSRVRWLQTDQFKPEVTSQAGTEKPNLTTSTRLCLWERRSDLNKRIKTDFTSKDLSRRKVEMVSKCHISPG